MKIVVYHSSTPSGHLSVMHEFFTDLKLEFYASSVFGEEFHRTDLVQEAVGRAMRACVAAGVPVRENFRPVYISRQGALVRDWRVSALAQKLILLNADPAHRPIARMQMKLVGFLDLL